MTDVNRALARARALLAADPLPGARERVHLALFAPKQAVSRARTRPLVFALAAVLTTSAAAFAVVEGPHFARTLARFRYATAPERVHALPHETATARQGARRAPAPPASTPSVASVASVASAPIPAAVTPSDASAHLIPDLPHSAHVVPGPAASPVSSDAPSTLAAEVAAYRDAEALVPTSPGLAITRLNAFRARYPASPLAEEAQLRLIQALLALGRDEQAREQARHFVVRYPHSAKSAELEVLANGGATKSY